MSSKPPILLAIDTPDLTIAASWVRACEDSVSGFKLGLEFFTAFGKEGVRQLRQLTDADLFLDLKLHDIPNTVAGAVMQIRDLRPRFLTVHASGGRAMIERAVASAPEIDVTAVTVLTSLAEADLLEIGFELSPLEVAVKMAMLSKNAGARAIVCSPLEISAIRKAVGENIAIITPGIRPTDSKSDDQQRTMSPKQALSEGASYLVIGRPITDAWENGASALRDRAAFVASQLK